MEPTKTTLAEKIEALARCTAAPEAFVRRVRELFARKGIGLEGSSSPFETLLERVFVREAGTRRDGGEVEQNLGRIRGHLAAIHGAFRDQIEQLRAVRREVEGHARRLEASASRSAERIDRSRMVRGEWDLPIVPGPEELH